jgi:hypothetical protein
MDPFEHGPVPLGWGTMISTSMGTAFFRGSVAASSGDGSFGIVVLPYVDQGNSLPPIRTSNVNRTSQSWTKVGFNNATAFNNIGWTGRVVSVGLKVYPQVAMTSPPGTLYAGAIPDQYSDLYDSGGYSVNSLVASPYLTVGYGNVGAMATGRPVDPFSFEFFTSTMTNWGTTNEIPFCSPIIAGIGFPVGTAIVYEVVLNFEFLANPTVIGSTLLEHPVEGDGSNSDSIPANFANIETMWTRIRGYLGSPAVVESVSNLASRGANAALRATAGILAARRSTGSTRRGQLRSALHAGLAAGAASVASSMRENIFSSGATGSRAAAALMP